MSIQSLFGEDQKRYICYINYYDEGQMIYMEGFGFKSLYGYDKQGRISSIEESGVYHKIWRSS